MTGGLSEQQGVHLETATQGTPGRGEQTEGLCKEAHVAMKPCLVTSDSDAPALWQPEELGLTKVSNLDPLQQLELNQQQQTFKVSALRVIT